jgi:S-DNA-T family DNA segregation ATPase FtsK/SpoIIIE
LILGVLIIFVAALTIVSLNTTGAAADPIRIFIPENLVRYGGYLGGAVAWVCLTLVGYAIAMVISIGAVVIGAVLIGFSLVSLAEWLNRLFWRVYEEPESTVSAYDLGENQAPAEKRRLFGWRRKKSFGQEGGARKGGMLSPTAGTTGEDQARFGVQASGIQGEFGTQAQSGARPWTDFTDDEFFSDEEGWIGEAGEPTEGTVFGVTQRIAGRGQQVAGGVGIGGDNNNGGGASGIGSVASSSGSQASTATAANGSSKPTGKSHTQEMPDYQLPNLAQLKTSRARGASRAADAELRAVAAELQETLQQFQVDAQVVGWTAGPTVTLYKLALGEGVRVARITSLSDDIALALAASSVRIFSPIPGTSLVGVEVPNAERSLVLLGDVLPASPSGALQLAIGKDVEGSNIVANLSGMPHLLIGGTTGSGKSVAINSMIMSMLMRTTPAEVRMILIDPKMVELTRYNDIPHLYVPVVTDAAKAASALAWSVIEMERRLKLFMDAGVKNVATYNDQVRQTREQAIKKAEKTAAREAERLAREAEAAAATAQAEAAAAAAAALIATAEAQAAEAEAESATQTSPANYSAYGEGVMSGLFELDEPDEQLFTASDQPYSITDQPTTVLPVSSTSKVMADQSTQTNLSAKPINIELELPDDLPEELPLIVIVIDELADLMIVAGKDVESSVTRLSQLARAAGLHLIIATQRPSTNVITGVIKANIVNRIAFNVGSGIDSRVILDSNGAEALLGNGDLLFSKPEYGKPVRIQGCFVTETEINEITSFWKAQGQPHYHEEILATAVGGLSSYHVGSLYEGVDSDDPLVWEAADIVVSTQMGSTSTLQRRLKVGYARAGRIMDNLEQKGIVGSANGSKPREVLVSDILELESIRALEAADR